MTICYTFKRQLRNTGTPMLSQTRNNVIDLSCTENIQLPFKNVNMAVLYIKDMFVTDFRMQVSTKYLQQEQFTLYLLLSQILYNI